MITIYDESELVSHAFMQSVECLKSKITLSFVPTDVIFSHNSDSDANTFQVAETTSDNDNDHDNDNNNDSTNGNVQHQSITADIPKASENTNSNETPGNVA